MWAISFLAFLANPLIGGVLLLSAAVTTGFKVAKVDAEYAKQGKTPPSYALVQKWLDSRTAKGAKPQKIAKPGMWRYAWQRWQAMWEDLSSTHREVRDQYKTAVVEAKKAGRELPPKPKFKETLTGWKWHINQLTAPSPAPGQPAAGNSQTAGNPAKAATPPPTPPTPTTPPATGRPNTNTEVPMSSRPPNFSHWEPDTDPAKAWSVFVDTNGQRWTENPDGTWKKTGHPHPATTIAGNPATRHQGGTTMTQATTQQSGEVTGLMSAISYAEAVASAHAAHSAGGGEQYRASLGQAKVGPGTIQSAADAQEASEIAAAKWAAHAEKLREQVAAKEATTAETGTKEFLLTE